jgi:DNA-binding transcriptional LysR family regulator
MICYARAAERLLIAGPSLSQQIMALERDLGVRLFERDRRSVALTPAGAALLQEARGVLDRADGLRQRARRLSGAEPVRLGYVNWLPPGLRARAAAAAPVHVDAWVAPSHTQADRVADGGLDLAVCWIQAGGLAARGLDAALMGADRLYAVAPAAAGEGPVPARDTAVLLDSDATAWSSWNAYAGELARDTRAQAIRISDGGITGDGFLGHVRRAGRPVINSPKGQENQLPPDLARRPVTEPQVYWTWSLVWRRGEKRAPVLAVINALRADDDFGITGPGTWLPADDPYRK